MTTRVTTANHLTPGFGQRLRRAREDAGYNRVELAELTNFLVTDRTLYAWESERSFPRLGPKLRAVAEVLDVPLCRLLRGDTSGAGADC